MNRLFSLLALTFLLLAAAPAAPLLAQETIENAAPAAIPGLAVVRNEATANFPEGIAFALDAEAEAPIAAVELQYRVPGLETWSVELPPIEAGATTLAIEQVVDLRSGELPPGLDVEYRWRITDVDGAVIETPAQIVPWIDSRYDWAPLAGPRVTVYTYDTAPDFQQTILDSAEQTIDSLNTAYGFLPEQPIRIWVYGDKDDLYGALAPNSEPWIAGAAYPALHVIMALLEPGDYQELDRVIPHEVTHQVLHQVTLNPFNDIPLWLNEGLAVYWQASGRDRFYSYALEAAANGEYPPLRTLNGEFDYNRDGALAAYALSLSAVIYILDTWGDEGMATLLETAREGITYDELIQQGLGISFDELDRQWREDLAADADRLLASGTTRFGDAGPGGTPGSSIWQDIVLAAESLIFGGVIVIAVVAGVISWLRTRRRAPDDEEETLDGVRWGEWPAGLETPGWQQQVPGQRGW